MPVDPAKARRKFDEFAERWLASAAGLKPKTGVGYESILRVRVLPRFSGVAVGRIERAVNRPRVDRPAPVVHADEPVSLPLVAAREAALLLGLPLPAQAGAIRVQSRPLIVIDPRFVDELT